MALINCPECGNEISDKSEKCINCGYPIKELKYEEYHGDIIDVLQNAYNVIAEV